MCTIYYDLISHLYPFEEKKEGMRLDFNKSEDFRRRKVEE